MPWTNASIVLNSRDRTKGTYNNSTFNAERQNIIQGQIDSISVNEVNFPYDIPNIQAGFNSFLLYASNGSPQQVDFTVTVPPGFYSGTELADAITAQIVAGGAAASPALAPADLPTCTYNDITNQFTMNDPTNVAWHQFWEAISDYTYPALGPGPYPPAAPLPDKLGKDIFSIMGYTREFVPMQIGSAAGVEVAVSGSAPLTFTQYIDICSPQLCKFQFFRDGSTTNLARRSDVICRLYIANSVAIQEPEGQRPFVISRQYNNARVMRWTADNSVGTIDIQLYDDVGQPLLTSWAPRPYQITFNCYEMNSEEVGGIHRGI